MLEHLTQYIESAVALAEVWGPLIIFIFMAVESSLVPFPSEIVMIPAGVIVARHPEFWWCHPASFGLIFAVSIGLAGSLAGAYFNYFLSIWLGRPFMYRYGKYFFLKPDHLERAEEIFREYGEVATFVCRLLPAIRQLISIPAGLSRMNFFRFSLFTGLGAGIWVAVLTLMGFGLGSASKEKTYRELVFEGKDMLHHNLPWLALGLAVFVVIYIWAHKRVMRSKPGAPKA
ncbi:DedA family protein [Candidatus Sumerlaeota bacterium]|nr:DedA family protein [Candidatus Sumerlaeota bacterium]